MKRLLILFSAILTLTNSAKAQSKTTTLIDTTKAKDFPYFKIAVDEIVEMLNGKKPLSFKRAVFLSENAYYNGTLNWTIFCNDIDAIKYKVSNMIVAKNLQRYKTAGNWAVFTFMMDSIKENDFKPYKYDFENFMGDKDYLSFMVANLLKTKRGNCHSLPYLYKILADEVNVEAFLALAPMHIFIKHKDEQTKWWNLELTSGTFSRTSFIIESFNVSDAGMESGLYMKPLTDKESVALCLADILDYYEKKTHIYSDNLVRKSYTEGLKYYPNSNLQLAKRDDIKYRLDKAMRAKGLNSYKKLKPFPDLQKQFASLESTSNFIKKIGYSKMTSQQYKEKIVSIKTVQQSQIKKH